MASFPGAGLFARFFGTAISNAAGYGVGQAVSAPLTPLLQELTNKTWATTTALGVSQPLSPGSLATGVAQGQIPRDWATSDAGFAGLNKDHFDKLIDVANVGPGVASAFDLWRRRKIDKDGFYRALKRVGLEAEWVDDLWDIREVRLDPSSIANAVQQAFVPNAGLLPDPDWTPPYNVPAELQDTIGTLAEFEASGLDEPRAKVLASLVGLPPAVGQLLELWNRGLIGQDLYERGVREGHTKTKWAPLLAQLRFQLLTITELANLVLRKWYTFGELLPDAEKLGYTKAQFEQVIKGQGRPLSFHQAFIGLRRGGVYDGDTGGIPEAFLRSLEQSNIRPEWYNLAWAQRKVYPTVLQLHSLTSSGALTAAETTQILSYEGWDEPLAAQVAQAWAGGKAAKEKELTKAEVVDAYQARYLDETQARAMLTTLGYTGEAQTLELQLADIRRYKRFLDAAVGKLHTLYISYRIDRTQAVYELDGLAIPAQSRDDILTLWDHEKTVNLPNLTATNIADLVKHRVWTHAQAIDGLTSLGWDADRADLFLRSKGE